MATHVRVKLKKAPNTESVITVKAYNLLKKKYQFIEYVTPEGGEGLTEVQKIMAEKKAQKKSAVAVEDEPKQEAQTEVSETEATESVTAAPNYELEDLRSQYEAKFGKPADKRMKVETLKAKINEG